jgi:hypothetical protein
MKPGTLMINYFSTVPTANGGSLSGVLTIERFLAQVVCPDPAAGRHGQVGVQPDPGALNEKNHFIADHSVFPDVQRRRLNRMRP